MVAVSVGDEELIRRFVHRCIRRPVQILRIVISGAGTDPADLEREVACVSELEDLVVVNRLEPWEISFGAVVASNPDTTGSVDVYEVFSLRPVVSRACITFRVLHASRRSRPSPWEAHMKT